MSENLPGKESIPALLGYQRIFSANQIRDLSGIHPGQKLSEGHMDDAGRQTLTPIEIMGEPFENNLGWWVRVKSPKTGIEKDMSLADRSVIPYRDGKWNSANWLETTESE